MLSIVEGSSVSLGTDLLSIYDATCRSLGVSSTCDADQSDHYVDDEFDLEMLPAEDHGNNGTSNPDRVGPTRSPDRRQSAAVDERTCKRPLSVSSTSSSMSSTSSLPRHEHKKLATSPSPLLDVTDPAAGCWRDSEAGAGSLSTVAEHAERCRLADDERPSSRLRGVDPSSVAPPGDDDDVDKTRTLSRSEYVDRVIAEIIDTERAYVDDLDQIIHVCITRSPLMIYHDAL